MSKKPDQTFSPITGMDCCSGGLRRIEMFSPAIGSSGQRMHAPPTLISLTSPSNEPWLVFTMADQSTGTLRYLRLSFCVISLHFLVICPHTNFVMWGRLKRQVCIRRREWDRLSLRWGKKMQEICQGISNAPSLQLALGVGQYAAKRVTSCPLRF